MVLSNDGHTRKELDHMLTRDCSIFCTYRVFRGAEAPAITDHRLVVGTVKLQPYLKPPKPTTKRLEVRSLKVSPNIATNYNIAVSNKSKALSALEEDLESSWPTIHVHSVILSAASETIGVLRYQRHPWLTSGTLDFLTRSASKRNCEGTQMKHVHWQAFLMPRQSRTYGKLADTAEKGLQRNNLPLQSPGNIIFFLQTLEYMFLNNKIICWVIVFNDLYV